jgi:hypothetical protein
MNEDRPRIATKDFTEEIDKFAKTNNLSFDQTFKLHCLINQIKLDALSAGMDKGQEITMKAYQLDK